MFYLGTIWALKSHLKWMNDILYSILPNILGYLPLYSHDIPFLIHGV